MNRCGTAPRPLFASLASQEGVVVIDDLVFGASAGGGRMAKPVRRRCGSVTVQGDEWSLVSLGTIAELGLRHARQNLPGFRRYLRSELTRAGPPTRDALDRFLCITEAFTARQRARTLATRVSEEAVAELDAERDFLSLPQACFPSPGIMLGSMIFELRLGVGAPSGASVTLGGTHYVVGFQWSDLDSIELEWRRALADLVQNAADRLPLPAEPVVSPAARAAAQAEHARTGAVRRGHLLYVTPASGPPRIGHLLPAYLDRFTGRWRRSGEVAVTHPIGGPPTTGQLQAYVRTVEDTWAHRTLSTGVCLGPSPRITDFGGGGALALAAFLRWCAIRIAANGVWHEQDF